MALTSNASKAKVRQRLDQALVSRGLLPTRSQAESYIKLGQVLVNGQVVRRAHVLTGENDRLVVSSQERYVSRGGLKLASVTAKLELDFRRKRVLDVGSSTGGFTDYALQHGAEKVIAVDSGSQQLDNRLRLDPRVELHEQTDIRQLGTLASPVDMIVVDVSFVSLRDIVPSLRLLMQPTTKLLVMVKPQFEASGHSLKHKGVIKNDRWRRLIFKDFESWIKNTFQIIAKADSAVSGSKGNRERFYLLLPLQK